MQFACEKMSRGHGNVRCLGVFGGECRQYKLSWYSQNIGLAGERIDRYIGRIQAVQNQTDD